MIGAARGRHVDLRPALRALDVIVRRAVDGRVDDVGVPADHFHDVDLAFVGPSSRRRQQPDRRPRAAPTRQACTDFVEAVPQRRPADELRGGIMLAARIRPLGRFVPRLDHQRSVGDAGVVGAVILRLVIGPTLCVPCRIETPLGGVDTSAVELVIERRTARGGRHRLIDGVGRRAEGGRLWRRRRRRRGDHRRLCDEQEQQHRSSLQHRRHP